MVGVVVKYEGVMEQACSLIAWCCRVCLWIPFPQRKHRGVMTKGVATFVHFYDMKLREFMVWGMMRWKRATASSRAKRREDAAVIVTRMVRGFYCRQTVKRMRMELALHRQREGSRLLARVKLRHASALDIQRVWRGYLKGRKLLAQKRREIHAARVIQRTRKRAKAKRAAWSVPTTTPSTREMDRIVGDASSGSW